MAKHLVVVTRSWPVTQGLPLALHELAEGTVSTDPLVALLFFFCCSEGSGMLLGDPLGEGSNASSTDNELWRAENSSLRRRGNSDAQKGAACS